MKMLHTLSVVLLVANAIPSVTCAEPMPKKVEIAYQTITPFSVQSGITTPHGLRVERQYRRRTLRYC